MGKIDCMQYRRANSTSGEAIEDISWEYKYQTNYNEFNTSKNGCRDSEVTGTPDRRGSIEILRRYKEEIQISTTYVIHDMDNTEVFSSTPKKLIENFDSIDPRQIIKQIAGFPSDLDDLEAGRAKLSEKIHFNILGQKNTKVVISKLNMF